MEDELVKAYNDFVRNNIHDYDWRGVEVSRQEEKSEGRVIYRLRIRMKNGSTTEYVYSVKSGKVTAEKVLRSPVWRGPGRL